MAKLAQLARPTASSSQNLPIVQAADATKLVAYGRLPDSEFDAIWESRMKDTQERLLALLDSHDKVFILDVNYNRLLSKSSGASVS